MTKLEMSDRIFDAAYNSTREFDAFIIWAKTLNSNDFRTLHVISEAFYMDCVTEHGDDADITWGAFAVFQALGKL